jgi:proline iminopeptidase
VSRLVLMDTCGDAWWARHNAPEILRRRGYGRDTVEAARRFYRGELTPEEVRPTVFRFLGAYFHRFRLSALPHAITGAWRLRMRPEAHVFGFRRLQAGWTVMDRLNEIAVPTLVLAGRHDFLFPPEHQAILADRLPDARLELLERSGHNPQDEQPSEVLAILRQFLAPMHRVSRVAPLAFVADRDVWELEGMPETEDAELAVS